MQGHLQVEPIRTGQAGKKEIAAWCVDLQGADAGRAYAALWRLAEVPGQTLAPYLRKLLQPVGPGRWVVFVALFFGAGEVRGLPGDAEAQPALTT